jgi:plasmid stabilization system protein ParE
MPEGPLDFREATMLPGGNVSYKRRVFGLASMEDALWELDFHEKLFTKGARFARNPEMITEFAHPHTLREYLSERFHVSYSLAAQRAANMDYAARIAAALARAALPVLLSARTSMHVFRRRKERMHLLVAFPWILSFSLIQTIGEAAGYLFPRRTSGTG